MPLKLGVTRYITSEFWSDAVPSRYWKWESDGRIKCTLCPRECTLRVGQRGLCWVRASDGAQVVLTAYGRSSGFSVDPIEKKPLNHFLPGTSVLSFGTVGCNLVCRFCQNWSISKASQFDLPLNQTALPLAIARAACRLGCAGVAFTYNDPVIFLEYVVDTAKACHALGLKTIAVTAGYISPVAQGEFFAHIDAANVDLKAFTESFYRRLTASHLEPVLNTLKYLKHETNVWLEITTLLIPGENDSPDEIDAMTRWIVLTLGPEIPLHFTAFHPDWKVINKLSTPLKTLNLARKIALANGMHHVYTGNASSRVSMATYCHGCGQVVIERDRYRISLYALTDGGRCLKCGTACGGVFRNPPGWENSGISDSSVSG